MVKHTQHIHTFSVNWFTEFAFHTFNVVLLVNRLNVHSSLNLVQLTITPSSDKRSNIPWKSVSTLLQTGYRAFKALAKTGTFLSCYFHQSIVHFVNTSCIDYLVFMSPSIILNNIFYLITMLHHVNISIKLYLLILIIKVAIYMLCRIEPV